MIKKKVMMLWIFVVVIIVCLAGLALKKIFFNHYIQDVVLTSKVVITSEWLEIGTPDLLKVEKDNHYVSLLLEPPFEDDTPAGGVKTPEGTIFNPEILLVDVEGKQYPLRFGGARGSKDKNFVNYRYDVSLPLDKKYSKVLIRSSVPLPLQGIFWSGYDTKDLR